METATTCEHSTKTFLHVGCGENDLSRTTPGFIAGNWTEVRFDIDRSVSPDLIGSMTDMTEVDSEQYDALFSSHNIEHLYFHEVPVALKEFHRVLKAEGFAVITCPDIQSVCAHVLDGRLIDPVYQSPAGPISPIDIMFGFRRSIADGNEFMAHKTAFTRSLLVNRIKAAGFSNVVSIKRGHPFYDIWALAVKSPASPETMTDYAKAHFPSGVEDR